MLPKKPHKYKGARIPKNKKPSPSLPKQFNKFISQGTSKEELELANALQLEIPNHKVYRGDRTVLHGREIDIYVPSLALGVEFHGLMWHKDKDPSYHLYKAVEAEKQGVFLIQIFEDEWLKKKALVVDLLRKVLGKYREIPLQDCTLLKLSEKEASEFFEGSHLLGYPSEATLSLGLSYKNELIYAAAIQETENSWIILRDAHRRTLKVEKALSAICSALLNKKEKLIRAVIDRRLSDGKDFKEIGFKELKATPPNVYYSCDLEQRILESKLPVELRENKDIEWYKYYDAGNKILGLN